MNSLVIALTVLSLAGCVSLTPSAEEVQVVRDANRVQGCQPLGIIEARSLVGGAMAKRSFENNRRIMRNQTAEVGGDTLLLLGERPGLVPTSRGEAYNCGR